MYYLKIWPQGASKLQLKAKLKWMMGGDGSMKAKTMTALKLALAGDSYELVNII